MQKPDANYMSVEEIEACDRDELLRLLLELRSEYQVVARVRTECGMANARLVKDKADALKALTRQE